MSLAGLHEELFRREYAEEYLDLAAMWADEGMWESGTRTALDVRGIGENARAGCFAPVSSERLVGWFGTDRPTRKAFVSLWQMHRELGGKPPTPVRSRSKPPI